MKSLTPLLLAASALLFSATASPGEIKILIDHNPNGEAGAGFKFKRVPPPAKNDAAAKAKFSIVDGERDDNGAELDALHDGKLPAEEDEPGENFFFNAGTEGGRLQVDLGSAIEIKQVNTYSWHPNTRGPQVYALYAADGASADFKPEPKKGLDPEKNGWKLVAKVDTRPKEGEPGGQYGVSISDSQGPIGKYRYLLFDISRTEDTDDFGNTFYSEIDVIDRDARPQTVESPAEARFNTLTDAEKAAGWKLLFNGRDFTGWHNFKRAGVRPGWQVKDGALVCTDPHNAGDIVTADKFQWFELELDYNISHAGNSGIMYRVTDEGNAVWATGPEFQLEDNQAAAHPVRCGWLYALYQPPDDPNTGKPLDATKPVGQWNHVRLLLSPEKCEHEINGVKYFDYVLGSEDFNNRVAKSKFARMPRFAKSDTGYIALQGDHGEVSFRNIKIRPLAPRQ
jgi:hypothetical protein